LFAGQDNGVWIANPDGSFPTQISEQWLFGFDLHHALSPRGDRLAVVARDDLGYALNEILLPSGESRTLARLLEVTEREEAALTTQKAIAAMMISSYDNVAWQPPDGVRIAVAAATDGPTSDIYLIDTVSDEIQQLTDGPSQAIDPSWSPDGAYLYHVGVSLVPPFGGAIVGFNRIDGAWSVDASSGEIVGQPPIMHPADFGGWLDERHYWMSDRDGRIASVDMVTGQASAVLPDFCPVYEAAQSTRSGAFLLSVLPESECPSGPGVYLWDSAEGEAPTLLDPQRSWGMEWLQESDAFYVYPIGLFSADGSSRSEPPVPDASYEPAVSLAGYEAWEIIQRPADRVVVRAGGGAWREIMEVEVAELLWDPLSGETLVIAARDGTLYAATAPDFVPRVMGDLAGAVDQAIWVP
jgi:hypothetical protein